MLLLNYGFQPLQWGRDQVIAEMEYRELAPLPIAALQWGRDQVIAEMRPGAGQLATARALQWGRDQVIAEMPVADFRQMERMHASMGPRSGDRGNQ